MTWRAVLTGDFSRFNCLWRITFVRGDNHNGIFSQCYRRIVNKFSAVIQTDSQRFRFFF